MGIRLHLAKRHPSVSLPCLVILLLLLISGCGSATGGSGNTPGGSVKTTGTCGVYSNEAILFNCPFGTPITDQPGKWVVEVSNFSTGPSSTPGNILWLVDAAMTNHSGAELDIAGRPPSIDWIMGCKDGIYHTDLSPFGSQVMDGQTVTARLHFDVPTTTHHCPLTFYDLRWNADVEWDLNR